MLKAAMFTFLSASSLLVLAGCESHQAKVDQLQKEYDRLSQQFAKDCSAEYMKTPPNLSPKCVDESKQMGEAGKRLREEQAKK